MKFNFIATKDIPDCYEAYLYIVVIESGKQRNKYIGWHLGEFDGTYKGSPKKYEEEFYEDLSKYEYKVYALDFGNAEDMIYEEKTMLDNVKNEGRLDELLNGSLGGGANLKNYNSTVGDIQDKIESGELPAIMNAKEIIKSWIPYQVRLQEIISGHVRELLDKINDTEGRYLKTNHRGVLVLEDYYGKGKHCRIGSRHTVEASCKSKFVKELKVIFIPKSMWKNLSKEDIIELGQWDNPQDEIERIATPKDETAEWVADVCVKEGIKPTHVSFKYKLKRQGYTKTRIASVVTKADKIIADREDINAGEEQIDWEKDPYKKTLATKIRSFKGIAFCLSVGNPDKMVQEILNLLVENPDERSFKLFAKVPAKLGAARLKRDWDSKNFIWVRERFNHLENFMYLKDNKKTLKIEIESLEFTKPKSVNL